MNRFLQKTIIILSILLPVLAGIFYFLSLSERDPTVVFKDPEKYPLEFRIDYKMARKADFILSIPLPDSVSSPIQLEIGNRAPERSWVYFHDVATRQPIPPNCNITNSSLKCIRYPLVSSMPGGYPEVIVPLYYKTSPPSLYYFRYFDYPENHGGNVGWGYFMVRPLEKDDSLLWYDRSMVRQFEMNFPDSGYINYDAGILAFQDIDSQQPGLELLVNVIAENSISSYRNRHQLRLYNLLTWQELWRVELPGINSHIPLYDGNEQLGFLLATGAPSQGATASGIDDSHSYMVKIGLDGEFLEPPELLYIDDSELVVEGLFPYPGDSNRVIVWSRFLRGVRNRSFIEIRRSVDFQVEKRVSLGYIFQCNVTSVAECDESGFRIITRDMQKNIELYDENLELLHSTRFGEDCFFIQTISSIHSPTVHRNKLHFLFGTVSGRLVLLDHQLRIVALENIAETPLHPTANRSMRCYRSFNSCSLDGVEYWLVNTSQGAFRCYWAKRPHMLFYSAVTGIGALFAWLLLYIFVLYRRWRFYRFTVNTMFRHSPDAILILNQKNRVRTMNRRFSNLLQTGSSQQQNTIKQARKEIPHKLKKRTSIKELLYLTQLNPLAEKIFVQQEFYGTIDLLEDNQPITILYRLDTMQLGKSTYGKVLVLQDITQHIEETKRTIWKFMAQNTAHRLKSPLQRIKTVAESTLIKRQKGKLEMEEVGDNLQKVLNTINDINQIIHDFLMVSDRKIKPQQLDLRAFLMKNIQYYRQKNLSDGIQLKLKLADNLPPVMADDYHLLTLLVNLLDNSLKAVQGKGQITVSAEPFTDSEVPRQRWLRLQVQDNGVGIPPEVLPKIFQHHESFFRNGHGIGLAVVHSIVQAHNGRISVASKPGEGTTFQVDLPLME